MTQFRLIGIFVLIMMLFSISTHALTVEFSDPTSEKVFRSMAWLNEEPKIYYLTFTSGKESVEEINLARWNKFTAGGRFDFLSKFFYANTRETSNRGYRHAACFEGNPALIAEKFLGNTVDIRDIHPNRYVSISSDGHLMGIQFSYKETKTSEEKEAHFRLPHCTSSGKAEIVQLGLLHQKSFREPQSTKTPPRFPAQENDNLGFLIVDEVKADTKNLPLFELKSDFEKKSAAQDRPWKDKDVSTEEKAFEFSEFVQAYFYDGMANQSPDPDQNFIAQKSRKTSWCHMPWLNVGPSGREAIHGMTMERDLYPSNIYPNTPPASDWGVAYYNAAGCETIQKVFGSPDTRLITPPDWKAGVFRNGAMAVKILFTTAEMALFKKAFTWTGHVSLPKSTVRSLRPVRHIQMDIAVRDSSIKGSKKELNNWVMTTYYFDPKYEASKNSPLRKIAGLPEGFLKMRPQGVQTGFNPEDSMVFQGAQTNQESGLLNGPADNPKSNCMACHGTAGTRFSMSPGIKDNKTYLEKVLSDPNNLDLSQQIALAKKNFETRFRAAGSGEASPGKKPKI